MKAFQKISGILALSAELSVRFTAAIDSVSVFWQPFFIPTFIAMR